MKIKIDSIKFYSVLAISLLFVDQLIKRMVIYSMPYHRVNSFFSIDLVFNRGMSFGLFHSQDAIVFSIVNIFVGLVILLLAMHTYSRFYSGKLIIGEVLIFTGAISNVIDRYIHSGVVDFIALSYGNWHFAVFNIADVFIFCGVMLMLILEYRESWIKS
ncbi:MAG: signal peptidase II [Candidatus Dependentiae bacterium]|nr:signal peptidase II [Candidatus Dependentiae bacterium]